MNKQAVLIESLAMDLKRVALGLHNGSLLTANRFKQEALKRESELRSRSNPKYLKRLLSKVAQTLASDGDRVAEDALMYSTLLQNFRLNYYKDKN